MSFRARCCPTARQTWRCAGARRWWGRRGFAVEKFQHFMPVTMHRYHARADMLHMARIGATLVEDCGPCALLSARGALADGVARDAVNAALAGSPSEGAPALAFAFGRSLAANAPDVAALGDAIEAAHGRAVRTELALYRRHGARLSRIEARAGLRTSVFGGPARGLIRNLRFGKERRTLFASAAWSPLASPDVCATLHRS